MPHAGAWKRAEKDVERLLRDGVDPPGDARLLERFRADRDESAFGLIVERHGPLVLALCRRYLREPADVDDAFQATFLVLARKGGGLRDGDALSSWLYGVARRVAIRARSDVLKRRAREAGADRLGEVAAAPDRPPDDALEALDRELASLPEKYRAPLVLCHLDGRTYDQAAAELGWPPGTVRSRMARAREILRDRLSRRGVDAPACLLAIRADVVAAPLASASLVAGTAAAAGRFVGLAPLSWIFNPTSWPAAALARGVISTMSPSQWKLLGVGIASIGLPVGAIAVASGGLTPAAQEKPREASPAVAAEEKPGPVPVERRLDDLEAKIDRIATMLAGQAAAVPSPPPPPRSSLDGGLGREETARPAVDARGLREIEAQLINAYRDYQRAQAMFERAIVTRQSVEDCVNPVRLLLARLLDMQDELKDIEESLRFSEQIMKRRAEEVDEANARLKRVQDEARKGEGPSPVEVAILQREAVMAWQALLTAKGDVERLNREVSRSADRSRRIARLVDWTREHFPDLELTIDDVAPDAK